MSQTLAYVRVSTEDQTDLSPEAQAKRCKELARWRDLGPVTVLTDEGISAKNLERPAMKKLLALVEAGEVQHLVIWRWDRLTRDQGDSSRLVKLFQAHGVSVHSVSDGDLNLASASGKAQVGFAGVIAQLQRDQIVENTVMGQREAAERGRWQNHPPTGYDMINGELIPNEMAPLVRRVFVLRAEGRSYPEIVAEVGIAYSTVRKMTTNRAYLGHTKYSDEWYPGLHAPWSMSANSTPPSAPTLSTSDGARIFSPTRCAVGSADVWRVCITTTATSPSIAVVTGAKVASSLHARRTAFTAPRSWAWANSRATSCCNRPSVMS